MTMISLVTIQNYSGITYYIPYVVYNIPVTYLFYNSDMYLLSSFSYFIQPSTSLPSGNHQSVFCIYESVPFCYICSFVLCFLDSTYKWNTDFVFFFPTYST